MYRKILESGRFYRPVYGNLHDFLDKFDVNIIALNNKGEALSDALKVTMKNIVESGR